MASDPLIGRQLANFRIERVLGRGGMAQVYYGRDIKLQRPVAVKVIDASFRGQPSFANRFVQEARTIATWRHENIIQIYYADNEGDLYYYVMEYVDGLDLAALLKQYTDEGELMPHRDVIRIGKAIAQALDYAHNKGIIHRDVKPSNVLISADDRVVLMDFGLAMDVAQGTLGEVFGTPHYIAPEQARTSAGAVPQSDLYALGVILYELLTGAVPFDDPAPTAVALQHLTMEPPAPRTLNPNLSEQVEQVLLKALSKSAADRYASGHDLMAALEKALNQMPVAKTSTAELPPPPAGMRSVSSKTVADKLALYTMTTTTAASYPEPGLPPTKRHLATSEMQRIEQAVTPPSRPAAGNSQRGLWILGALALAGILVVAVVGLLLMGGEDEQSDSDISEATITETVSSPTVETPTLPPTVDTALAAATEAVVPSEVAVQPTTQTPPTTAPTNSPTEQPTNTTVPPTDAPSNTPFPPTNTSVPPTVLPSNTPVPSTEAVAAAPTIKYPNGKLITLYYNPASFYTHNQTGEALLVASLKIERVMSDGTFTNLFDGRERWAGFYPRIDNNACGRMELTNASPWLRPSACRGYNITTTPTTNTSWVFWTPLEGSTQFRVLWNDEEVGRCEIAAGQCEVYLP